MENIAKIGVDIWSIVLYSINYGVILFILGYFVYPKIKKVIFERKRTIKKNLNDVKRLQKEFETNAENAKKEKEKIMKEMQKKKEELEKDLEVKRKSLIAEMDAERSKILNIAKEQIEEQKQLIINSAENQIVGMVERVVLKILSSVSEQEIKQSVTKAWETEHKRFSK